MQPRIPPRAARVGLCLLVLATACVQNLELFTPYCQSPHDTCRILISGHVHDLDGGGIPGITVTCAFREGAVVTLTEPDATCGDAGACDAGTRSENFTCDTETKSSRAQAVQVTFSHDASVPEWRTHVRTVTVTYDVDAWLDVTLTR